MTVRDIVFNLGTINNLNPKARALVAENAARVIRLVLRVAENHDLTQRPYDWYVDCYNGQPCCSEGGCVECTCFGGDDAGVTAGFVCDCVNAVRDANSAEYPNGTGPEANARRYCAAPCGHFCDDAVADEKSGCDICTKIGDCPHATEYPAVAAELSAASEAEQETEVS